MGSSGLTVGIYGLGLIGGSIALAVRRARPGVRVIGYGRNDKKLELALQSGMIDEAATESSPVTGKLDFFIIATPVNTIGPVFSSFQNALSSAVIVMDAASVKQPVLEAVAVVNTRGLSFVGTHPMAGSEKTGPESARADLFEKRVVVLTGESPENVYHSVKTFWEALGSRTVVVSARVHDEIVALTSHLPHLAASALIGCLDRSARSESRFQDIYGKGLLDTTRIAQGDPGMWADIILSNAPAIVESLGQMTGELETVNRLVRNGDRPGLVRYLAASKAYREKLS